MRQELERVQIPGEHRARERGWATVEAAFSERSPAPRTSPRRLLVAIALALVLGLIGAAVSPPGRAVLDQIREVIGVEHAAPALFNLPTSGDLLVQARSGVWVVHSDGSRRLLGRYTVAGWSPFGRYVVAARGNELSALDQRGVVRWSLARPNVSSPRWAGTKTDTRIAYLDRGGIHVVGGDGRGDHRVAAKRGLVAWRSGSTFQLAVLQGDLLRVIAADTGRVLSRIRLSRSTNATGLQWSPAGDQLLIVYPERLELVDVAANARRIVSVRGGGIVTAAFSADGRQIALLQSTKLSLLDAREPRHAPKRLFAGKGPFRGVAWSPDGGWLLLGWPAADQWVFVRADGNRIRAVSRVAAQFRSTVFPRVDGWAQSSALGSGP